MVVNTRAASMRMVLKTRARFYFGFGPRLYVRVGRGSPGRGRALRGARGKGRAHGGGGLGRGVVVKPHPQHDGVFVFKGKKDQLCTKNLVPGRAVYGEKMLHSLEKLNGGTVVEYRVWDPSKSDLASVILKGVDNIYIKPGAKVLYLGADSLATLSHVSDIVGKHGLVYAVTSSHGQSLERPNVVHIVGDLMQPDKYTKDVGEVDVILSEVPQFNQGCVMGVNADQFMKAGTHFVASIKTKYIKKAISILDETAICYELQILLGNNFRRPTGVFLKEDHVYFIGTYDGLSDFDSD